VRAAYPYWSEVPTRWNDNDVYGHVNNSVHYAAMDTVINRWMIEQGLLDINDGDSIGLCVESGCRYLAAIQYPDVLAVGLRIARLGNSSVTWEVGLVRDRDELSVAEGRFVHVFVDAQTRRPRPLSDRHRTAMKALLVDGAAVTAR
jgi:acyl-CoA thioester hydrolase